MKISELPDCPQWLRDARTENADVEWGNGPGSWIVWRGGNFRGGNFLGGNFLGGSFLGGSSSMRSPYTPIFMPDGTISVGCKRKTAAEWETWLDGTEEYSTRRTDPKFRLIEAHIRAAIAYSKVLNPAMPEAGKK